MTEYKDLTRDPKLEILSYLDDKSLLDFCKVDKTICENEDFWRKRLVYYYGENAKSFKTKGSWKDFYLKIIYYLDRGLNHFDGALFFAAKEGDLDMVKLFIYKGAKNDWNRLMSMAAEKGDLEMVVFFIEKGAKNWSWGLSGAATGGHRNLAEFFIEKGATNWGDAMVKAANAGHLDLVKFFIGKGANNWQEGILHAGMGGHLNIVKFLTEKKAEKLGK